MSSVPIGTDPGLQTLRITDFSPGIVNFARYSFGTTYSPSAPLGSAASAFRCINRPGVGLVPMPLVVASHSVAASSVPDANTTVYCTGFQAFGPVITDLTYPQRFDNVDQLFVSLDYISGAARFRQVTRMQSDISQTQAVLLNQSASISLNYRFCPDFVVTRIFQNGFPSAPPVPVVVWCELDLSQIWFSPDVTSNLGSLPAAGHLTLTPIPIHTLAHASRVLVLNAVNVPTTTVSGTQNVSTDEDIFTTDPPMNYVVAAGFNAYDPEHFSGFGAWGSINSGELLIIHRGGGAILISGDARAPSGVTKLPGVVGTGRVMQKAVHTAAGLLYVTENDGVYSWNGGNTSQKVSTQIPDDACRRKELDNATVGTLTVHDQQNNLCFFANNWVFDCLHGTWWRIEDPAITSMSVFSRSAHGRYMWAAGGSVPAATRNIPIYQIDFQIPAPTWTWLSNPIPVSVGSLMELEWVEIVASNPTPNTATFTIAPATPTGTTDIAGNNPQSVTFTVQPNLTAARMGQRLGFHDYNIQLQVTAANTNLASEAPILHELILGYRGDAAPIGAGQ